MVLIGESLMRSSDPTEAIKNLCLDPNDYDKLKPLKCHTKIIKICGITSVKDALFACQQGVNLIGVIFATSKRQVTIDQAKEIVKAVRNFGEREHRIYFTQSSFQDNAFKLEKAKIPLVVGVFQNHSVDYINHVVQETGIDFIQLHGQ